MKNDNHPITGHDEEAAWWREDAANMNRMCELAKKNGLTVPTNAGPPPPLNPDGSLKDTD